MGIFIGYCPDCKEPLYAKAVGVEGMCCCPCGVTLFEFRPREWIKVEIGSEGTAVPEEDGI